jgi:hypothetical protein
MENVDHHIGVIRDDPLARGEPVDGHGLHPMFFLEPIMQLSRDGLQVWLGGAGADHEKIGEGRDRAEVDGDDVFGFLVSGDGGAEAGEGFRFDGVGSGKGGVVR